MKKLLTNGFKIQLLFFTLLFSVFGMSQNPQEQDSYYNHMVEINKEWAHFPDACPSGTVTFKSDADRISTHLKFVCAHLNDNLPAGLNKQQVENRSNLIAALEVYAANKVFPTNLYHNKRTPYFVDDYGVHCAVGHLMDVSAHDELVARIVEEHNYDYLRDIKTDGVVEWASEFGFTLQEVKWIQPSYAPQTQVDPIGGGTNAPVTNLHYDSYNNRMLISGIFSELDDSPCMGIGQLYDNQLSCLGGGLNGEVKSVFTLPEGVFAVGNIVHNSTTYPLAFYNDTSWSYIGVPNRPNAAGVVGARGDGTYSFEIVIKPSSNPALQEIWYFGSVNGWQLKADVNGEINDIAAGVFNRAYLGHFDQVSTYSSSNGDSSFVSNNLLIKESFLDNWAGSMDDISDTLETGLYIGGALYLGGTCSLNPGSSNVCLSRYLNETVQPLILRDDMASTNNIVLNDLVFDNSNRIVIGGNFYGPIQTLTYGQNLATYNVVTGFVEVVANTDSTVNSVAYLNNELYLGGDFNNNGWSSTDLNHLGRLFDPLTISDPSSENYKVYPNPFMDEIAVEGAEEGAAYTLTDASGKEVKVGSIVDNRISDLSFLAKGTYLLTIQSSQGPAVVQLVK